MVVEVKLVRDAFWAAMPFANMAFMSFMITSKKQDCYNRFYFQWSPSGRGSLYCDCFGRVIVLSALKLYLQILSTIILGRNLVCTKSKFSCIAAQLPWGRKG
jgi:hypothetical protein